MTDYIIVSKDPDVRSGMLYLCTGAEESVFWTRDIKWCRRFVTFGAAKLFAEARLPIDREYKIVTIPSVPGGN